ncbi:sugar 3,4-ketoisomerase [Marinilactibacillus kalidii]|uniref:sugar 3,4-ketoisomerase n=1 Tax=Marinilactibacillus kalidii TaxID=2820274 RepID=UPI001ABDDC3C|nr:FdtA/QdtA family cupin domain-containing protein [Marinilactibacillus kalidii]
MKNNNSDFKKISFKQKGDERGSLIVIENNIDVPFEIKRVFYIYGTEGNIVRGQHANRKTEFVLINISGSSKIKIDNGTVEQIIDLKSPDHGVYIPKMVWKEMYDFSENSILLVLASEPYDSEEYINNYEEYLKEV